MQIILFLPLPFLLTIFTLSSLFASSVELNIMKVGNYPNITWIKEKMLLSQDEKYLFLVNHNTPYKIDILDISDLHAPKLLSAIIVDNKKDSRISTYKLSQNKHRLYVANNTDAKIFVYDVENIKHIKKVKEIPFKRVSTFAVNGNYLYIAGCRNTKYCDALNVYDLEQNRYVAKSDIQGIIGLTVSPNRKRVLYGIATSRKERIGLADISNVFEIRTLDETGEIFNNRRNFSTSARLEDIVFSADSSKVYIAGNEVGLMVYDVSKDKLENIQLTAGTHFKMFFNTTQEIYSLAISKGSKELYMAGIVDSHFLQIKSIKGVNHALLLQGRKIVVSDKGHFFIIGNENGLDFYSF